MKRPTKKDVNDYLLKCKFVLCLDHGFIPARNLRKKPGIIEEGLNYDDVKDVLIKLEFEDYVAGPELDEDRFAGYVWLFGKWINSKEFYIKIKCNELDTHGEKLLNVYCLSFHYSEHPLNYPFK